jgi:hypothetical protein
MTVPYRCTKLPYSSHELALKSMRKIRAKYQAKARPRQDMPIRVYRCETCNAWHLTSMPLARTRTLSIPHRKAA